MPTLFWAVRLRGFALLVAAHALTACFDRYTAGEDLSHSTIATPTPQVPADGVSLGVVDVTLQLGDGTPIAGASVRFESDCSQCVVSQPVRTDAQGHTQGTFSSSQVATATVRAVASTPTFSMPVPGWATIDFAIFASPTRSTFTASPNSLQADGVAQSTLTLTARDAEGVPLSGQPVTVAVSGEDNFLLSTSDVTDASGTWSATLSSHDAEQKVVTAHVGNIALSTLVTFIAGGPSQSTTTVSSVNSPGAGGAGGGSGSGGTGQGTGLADGVDAIPVSVTVRDPQGNPVPGATVTFTSSDPNSICSPVTAVTDANGVASTGVTSTVAGTPTVTATTGTVSVSTTVTFVPPTPSLSTSALVVTPSSQLADGVSTMNITVTVEDAAGVAMSGQNVVVGGDGNNTTSPASFVTDTNGQVHTTLAATVAQSEVVSAVIDGNVTLTQNVLFYAGNPNQSKSTFTLTPTTLTADGVSYAVAHVTLQDRFGNPTSSQAVTLSGGTSNVFTPAASGVTDGAGSFSAHVSTTLAQSETVAAATAAFTMSAALTFTAGPASAAHTSFTASPTSVLADGSHFSALRVTTQDASGNPISGQGVTFSGGVNNTYSPSASGSTVGGVFNANVTTTKAQVETVSAVVAGMTFTSSVTFTAGPPSSPNSTLSATPTQQTADGVSPVTLSLHLADAFGNATPGQPVTFSGGTSNVFAPSATGTTDATGAFSASAKTTIAQSESVTATVPGFTKTAAVTFVAGAFDANHTSLTLSPNTATADGSQFVHVAVSVADAYNNPVTGQAVTFLTAGISNVFSPAAFGNTAAGVFNANVTTTKAQSEVLEAKIGSLTLSGNVVFTAGGVNGNTSTASVSPTTQTADGTSFVHVTATMVDTYNNPISGMAVSFVASGTSNLWSPSYQGTTDGNGVFNANLTSTLAQVQTISAQNGVTYPITAGSVTFTAGAPAALSFTSS